MNQAVSQQSQAKPRRRVKVISPSICINTGPYVRLTIMLSSISVLVFWKDDWHYSFLRTFFWNADRSRLRSHRLPWCCPAPVGVAVVFVDLRERIMDHQQGRRRLERHQLPVGHRRHSGGRFHSSQLLLPPKGFPILPPAWHTRSAAAHHQGQLRQDAQQIVGGHRRHGPMAVRIRRSLRLLFRS